MCLIFYFLFVGISSAEIEELRDETPVAELRDDGRDEAPVEEDESTVENGNYIYRCFSIKSG